MIFINTETLWGYFPDTYEDYQYYLLKRTEP